MRAITFWTNPQCVGTSVHQPIHVDKKKTSSSALQGWWANCPNRYASPFQSSNHQSHGPRSQGLRAHASIQHHDKSCFSRRTVAPPSHKAAAWRPIMPRHATPYHAARPATRAAPPPPRSANAASHACSTKGGQRLPRATCPPPAGPMLSSEFSAQPGP